MTLKRACFRFCIRTLELFMRMLPKGRCIGLPLDSQNGKGLDLVTVAFNNDALIARQHQFISRFVKDDFVHIVADNSTDHKCSERLQNYCRQEGIAYVRLPLNLLGKMGSSYSHSAAVNYVYHKIICRRNPAAFGYIDHDLFPIKDVMIGDYLKNQPFYGPLRVRQDGKYWYLSAIMSFFDTAWVKQHGGIDYMPVTPDKEYLDSGGGNWYRLYSVSDRSVMKFPNEEIVPLREGGDRHGASLEYFDDRRWLHTINGSCWKAVSDGKDCLVQSVLDEILKG